MRLRFSKCSMVFWFSLSTTQCLVLNSIRVRDIECILYNVVQWTVNRMRRMNNLLYFVPFLVRTVYNIHHIHLLRMNACQHSPSCNTLMLIIIMYYYDCVTPTLCTRWNQNGEWIHWIRYTAWGNRVLDFRWYDKHQSLNHFNSVGK